MTTFSETNYFPVPCDRLTDDQKKTKFEELLMDIQWIYSCSECEVDQAFVDCPPALPQSQ